MNRLIILICACAIFIPSLSSAASRKLPNGAGTLSQGENVFSLDLGYNFPSPILYEVRADFGVRDRFQFGVGASILIIANVLTFYPKYNIWKTYDERNFLSAYFYPSITEFGAIMLSNEGGAGFATRVVLRPGIAYEHRFDNDKSLGLYLLLGTAHNLHWLNNGNVQDTTFASNSSAIQLTPGIQKYYGGKFSITVEPTIYIPFHNKLPPGSSQRNVGLGGRFGFSWTF